MILIWPNESIPWKNKTVATARCVARLRRVPALTGLRQTPFVVLPSGTLDGFDDRRFIAQLSFPSRIPYILATSHSPILVLGSPATAAAHVVRRLGIGLSALYDLSLIHI